MENITIRESICDDIPSLLELLYELGRPKSQTDSELEKFEKLLKNYMREDDKKILIAQINDSKIIGMISMVFLSRLNQNTLEMYIPELIVSQNYHSNGIGKKLINSSIEFGKEKKCHRIRLESGNQRIESHKFYKHLGFETSSIFFTKDL
ncbi:MAG: GNAT family N-acetyltransferase [Nitrosopumilus sp.]|jgi:ribosomal protein S18 acetylase RimI-like enzyme|nr:GNAT family N-acetyltransferase [Nitrosopumilus sp.]MBT3573948.1 GNAT family N-acetyltransferase [Nitrosopumilus sp.]MBT3861840.1 GNAT family N-acetyltransferase [Nitrosopumilus sp.]MBT3956504.1 GNAT family N-acetyltransferase [Nitrosopumilus sp.]MBT4299220.1 GNAT family N-acetyltransferase [Nitrosopumilus sp.]